MYRGTPAYSVSSERQRKCRENESSQSFVGRRQYRTDQHQVRNQPPPMDSRHFRPLCPTPSMFMIKYAKSVFRVVSFLVGRHSSIYQTSCSFCDTSTKFGRSVVGYLGNKSGYWAIANSHPDDRGSNFFKWQPAVVQNFLNH